jgi:membrane protein required for colicin V production
MIIDSLVLIFCILAFWRGWNKGLLWAICSMLAVLLGSVLSLKLAHSLSQYLFTQNILTSKYTLLISYILIFVIVLFAARLLVKFVEKILSKLFLGWANKLSGAMLYMFFTLFVFSSFIWLGKEVQLVSPSTEMDSKTYPFVQPIAPFVISNSETFLPFCKNLFADVKLYLEKVSTSDLLNTET